MREVSGNIYDYLSTLYGREAADKYLDFIRRDQPQYLRVNLLKTTVQQLQTLLQNNYNIQTEKINKVNNGLKVLSGFNLTGKTIEHITGLYYIQSLSSMLPPLVLNPSEEDTVLDICSAPGSKTTQISELMNNRGVIVANEIQLDRLKSLVFNLDRMNIINAGVMHYKGEWLNKMFPEYFDKVLVDAPCSGLGIIQKKSEVSSWWSVERVNNLGELQLKLLVGAIKMTKPGGEIIYSTCTLTVEENEFVLNKILEKYPVTLEEIELPVHSVEAFTSYDGASLNSGLSKARRILPWEVESDGFFIAKIRKYDETVSPEPLHIKEGVLQVISANNKKLKKYFGLLSNFFGIDPAVFQNYKYLIKGNDIFLLSSEWNEERLSIFERIGSRFGIINKNDEITLHTNAAQLLDKYITKSIYTIENREDLKTYLEGGTIKKDTDFKGQCVVKYNNLLLGTGVIGQQGIKSRFPRSKRTQEIFLDF
jgi:16S rRNA (cytosine1407-C5)-methyltransferase